jgi:hypothetical protein
VRKWAARTKPRPDEQGGKQYERQLRYSDRTHSVHLSSPTISSIDWAGRTSDLTLGNVAAYCYCEYEAATVDSNGLEAALQRLIAR